jgi:hypothetical protein
MQAKRKSGLALAGRQLLYMSSPIALLAVAAVVIVALRAVGIID